MLTNRENQIIELMSNGNKPKKIAKDLGISHKVVKHYLSSIYQKLGFTGEARPNVRLINWFFNRGQDRD